MTYLLTGGSAKCMAHRYHSYYTISANPIYMDPDYNSPLSYCWGYYNLSIQILVSLTSILIYLLYHVTGTKLLRDLYTGWNTDPR